MELLEAERDTWGRRGLKWSGPTACAWPGKGAQPSKGPAGVSWEAVPGSGSWDGAMGGGGCSRRLGVATQR